uniref:Uncharacterized protein n=1 Tax=Solanum lycopersicum TaxID=4081 RepID=A0A3Q7ECR8_SOLLC
MISQIVYEALNRIQKLQNTFNKLKSQKLERLEENNIMLAKDESGVAQFSEAFTVEDMYKQVHSVEDERLSPYRHVYFSSSSV